MTTDVKVGDRVRLVWTDDPYTRLRPDALGTVTYVRDRLEVGVAWDDGSSLSLIPHVDRFEVVS